MIRNNFYYNQANMLTATTTISFGSMDVRNYERFCITVQNNNTAIGLMNLSIQAAQDVSGTGSDVAPNWLEILTTTLPVPSAAAGAGTVVGATGIYRTSAIDNVYSFIRILTGASQTAAALTVRVTITGQDGK